MFRLAVATSAVAQTLTSDAWIFAGWTHCVSIGDLQVVDNQQRIVSVLSGQVKQNPALEAKKPAARKK